MKNRVLSILCSILIISLVSSTGIGAANQNGGIANQYSLEQAMSDNAQLSTIAFSGLAFITGSAGADTFMPPGKVADFFGFQYMRDVDTAGYGHNTTFLSRVANNVLYILNDTQKAKLLALAKEQAPLYTNFAYNRFPIMNAFRRSLEGNIPSGSSGLSIDAVSEYTGDLYNTDADLSYKRAVVVGGIINSFTDEQKAYLSKMQFNNYLSWPDVKEDETLKKSISNNEFVCLMTYASELFSWYKGSLEADVYFCPERHGTYFGGFYMKDYPAMNNPEYFISTAITGDSGQGFLNVLNTQQKALVTGIIDEQRSAIAEIAQIRTTVSTELRKAMSGGIIDKTKVYSLIKRYGELDGQISALYAIRFSEVNKTLTDTQRAALVKLRNLDVVPKGAYRFSTPVAMPEIPNTDFMFGVGSLPQNAGQISAPTSFGTDEDSNNSGTNLPKPSSKPTSKPAATPAPNGGFDGSIVLGRPTNTSMTASVTANQEMNVYISWGATSNKYSKKSNSLISTPLKPATIVVDGLKANSIYYYKLYFKNTKDSKFSSTPEYSFTTPRTQGQSYSFVVQSDSHLLNKADKELYTKSMQTMSSFKPDFMFDMGDTFLHDQVDNPQNQKYEKIRSTTAEQLSYFDIVTRKAPLFLTMGNHEGEYGYFLDGTNKNLTVMSTLARTTYYPNPVPNSFYTGNTQKEAFVGQPQNYYAFTWGDALYVSIDPYRYSINDPYNDKDGWNWTLGKTQYDWFKKTLETSKAKYKFVFSHHAIGNVRGGAEVSKLYEWGGYDKNGKYLFGEKRPGWGKPIQKIMKDSNVTIFFQGHDHLFAREVVDGVVYQTLPKPAEKIADAQSNYVSYPKADVLMNSGFLKIGVTAANVKVNYYRNYFVSSVSQTGNTGIVYSYTVDSKHNVKVIVTKKDDLTKYGDGTTSKGNKEKNKKNKDPKSSVTTSPTANATETPAAVNGPVSGVILGAPQDTSIKAKAVANKDASAYFEYGTDEKNLTQKTSAAIYKVNDVIEASMTNLDSDTQYYYRMLVKESGEGTYKAAQSGSFHTKRASGEAFTFTIQADSHRDENTSIPLYNVALENMLKDNADFHVDLGDTFFSEKLGKTEQGTLQRYLEDRSFFEKIGFNIPLFLVNGNHEGEFETNNQNSPNSVASWAVTNRLKYFVNPISGNFFTGSEAGKGNYYSYTWGNALFVMLDPYWFSQKSQGNDDGWKMTLGKTQYDWLKTTLESSKAKFKFVFTHSLVGGYTNNYRGGAEAAKFFEWGGYNANGTYEFDKMRPGWGKPIHQLMVENKVTAVFHGHDHFYAKQELDGIVYQLLPQPGNLATDVKNATEYSYKDGLFLPPAGHLRVSVSSGNCKVEYVKASLQSSKNGTITDSYIVNVK